MVYVLSLRPESTSGDILVAFSPHLEVFRVKHGLSLVHLKSKQFVVVLLSHLVFLVANISQALDLVIDILELLESLVNGGIELHSVLSGVLQSLLKISDFSGKFALS